MEAQYAPTGTPGNERGAAPLVPECIRQLTTAERAYMELVLMRFGFSKWE